MKPLLITLFALLFAACASTPSYEGPAIDTVELEDESIDNSLVLAQRRAIDRIQAQVENDSDATDDGDIPEKQSNEEGKPQATPEHVYVMKTKEDHPKVQKWLEYYSVKDRERFQRFLNRGAKYKQVIQDLLVTNGLPPDLYYLGILESGYVTKAVSHAGAVGPWQFMAPTGRQYGLKIDYYVDERIDPIRSTLAAIRYLKELYRMKKSWHMALAAYNAGPGRVKRAMRRGGSRNYWNLTRRRLLPYDTREYIPQFLAILTIGKNPARYGFHEKAEEQLKPMELVKVPSPISLKKVAELTNYSLSDLKAINPHLRRGVTPPTKKKTYHLWVHKNQTQKLTALYDELQKFRVKGLRAKRLAGTSVHRVRRGQNLSYIARRYGTTVRNIRSLNNLRSNRIYIGQRLRVKGRSTASVKRTRYHRVQRGQTLSGVARRYGMSISKIKRLNGMRSNRILVGQRLKVYGSSTPTYSRSTYRVRRGDNLTEIAQKAGSSVAKIKRLNNLDSGRIYPGQKLRLVAGKKKMKRYRIRRGDNLYSIAKRFGTTIGKIKRINKLSSNRIMRGQVLLIASNH